MIRGIDTKKVLALALCLTLAACGRGDRDAARPGVFALPARPPTVISVRVGPRLSFQDNSGRRSDEQFHFHSPVYAA